MKTAKHLTWILTVFIFGAIHSLCAFGGIASAEQQTPYQESGEELPFLSPEATPLAGEGFRTRIFGRDVVVDPRSRRSISAWDLGAALYEPPPQGSEILPVASLYLWKHPDDYKLLRAELSAVVNNLFWSRSPAGFGPFEWVLTFSNYTIPAAQSELVDGRHLESEELLWGYVRPGFGFGYRKQVYPGRQENMLAIDLTFEPGYLYFDNSSLTAPDFVVPQDTFELRTHLQMRWDAMVRNLLELPHRGFVAGADLVYGYRFNWENWGLNGSNLADDGRDYYGFAGCFAAAGGVPGIKSERHRLVGSVHGGAGHNLDRFSAPQVGGGPIAIGQEYGSTARPVLPGSTINEFNPDHYVIAVAEYRFEPIFFVYLSIDASVGWLDRLRQTKTGINRENGFLPSVGARVVSGFFFHTRLQLDYNYNFGVIRQGHYGGHEVVLQVARNL